MEQIQQFDLGRVMQQAGTINAQRRQNRLLDLMAPYQEREVARNEQEAVAQQKDAELKRKALYSKVSLSLLGDDFEALPDDQKQARYGSAMMSLEQLGAPKEWLPEKFTPEIYKGMRSLAGVYDQADGGRYQFGADDYVQRDGKTFRITSRKNQRTGEIELVETPVTGNAKIVQRGTGLTAGEKADLDIKTAGRVEEAKIGAQVQMAPQVAESEANIAAATQRAGTAAKSNIETLNAYVDAGQDAVRGIVPVTRAIELLDRVETGGLQSEWGLRLRQLTGSESADQGELSNLLGKSVLAQLKPVFGSAFTAAEGERLTNIEASFGRSPATNRRLLQNALDIMRDAAERGARAARKRGDDFTAEEIERKLEAFSSGRDQAGASQRPPQRQPAPAQPPRPAQLPATNAKGWRLMTDAKGNRAYVSPDGRQYEEVR